MGTFSSNLFTYLQKSQQENSEVNEIPIMDYGSENRMEPREIAEHSNAILLSVGFDNNTRKPKEIDWSIHSIVSFYIFIL